MCICDSGERIDSEYGEEMDSLVDLTISVHGKELESQLDMTHVDASQLNSIVEQVALEVFPGGGTYITLVSVVIFLCQQD